MKLAFIFPPQWDPRQPPLSIPALIGALNANKINVTTKVWDFNLALYAELLCRDPDSLCKLKDYLDINNLENPKRFKEKERVIENIILNNYDDNDHLFFDMYYSKFSPNNSKDWLSVLLNPKSLPLFKYILKSIYSVANWSPDIIAISTCSETQLINSLAIASILDDLLPKSFMVIGGAPFSDRKDFFQNALFLFDYIDCICIGDGEPTLIALCNRININNIPNIIWKHGESVVVNHKEYYSYHDNYIADFKKIEIDSYLSPATVLPIETSRGCYWGKCRFCNHPNVCKGKNRYFKRDILQIIKELNIYSKNGVKNFFFIDEAIPASRIRKISRGIIQSKLDINWIFYCRLDKNIDKNTLIIAKKSGLKKIFFGLESGSDRILRLINKGTISKTCRDLILTASEIGISLHLFLIGGFPRETDDDFENTLKLLDSILPKFDQFGFTYNFFPLTCGYGTQSYFFPSEIEAIDIDRNNDSDMATRYFFMPSYSSDRNLFEEKRKTIHNLIKNHLGDDAVLLDCNFTNDSSHLLVLSKRNKQDYM